MAQDNTSCVATESTLGGFTRPGLIVPELHERDAAGIIGELSQVLLREFCVPDLLPFYHAAVNQELLNSSALKCGIALPHARLSGIRELQFALGRTKSPVFWGARDTNPVQLVFLLAVPATDAACYLNVLASLARLGQQPEIIAKLLSAHSPSILLAILNQVRLREG